MSKFNHVAANGYSIDLNIHVASIWDQLFGTVVKVHFMPGDVGYEGLTRGDDVSLYGNRTATAPPHELGHVLGFSDDEVNQTSMMWGKEFPVGRPTQRTIKSATWSIHIAIKP